MNNWKVTILISILLINIISSIIFLPSEDANNRLLENNNWIFTPRTIIVDVNGNGDYEYIQDAINASKDGDTIIVESGLYIEHLIVNKSIELRGREYNKSILLGMRETYDEVGMIITANNVTISNFQFNYYRYGLYIQSKNVEIMNNVFMDIDFDGIEVYKQNLIVINNNKFINVGRGIACYGQNIKINNNMFFEEGLGIFIMNLENSTIENNSLICSAGFNIIKEKNNVISNNSFLCQGIIIYIEQYSSSFNNNFFMRGENAIFLADDISNPELNKFENLFIENMSLEGIFIKDDKFIIKNCSIKNCKGPGIKIILSEGDFEINDNNINKNSRGMLFESTKIGTNLRGNIINNSIENNINEGIYLYQSEGIFIKKNFLKNNGIGIKAWITKNNVISSNYLFGNNKQAITDSYDKWQMDYPVGGNYWSDYIGKDVMKGGQQSIDGSDGFGDTPYYINGTTRRDLYPIFKDTIKPNAEAGPDIRIDQGSIYHFNSNGSSDDQLIHRAVWEFDYGGEHKNIPELSFDFKFEIPGEYVANLTVFDFPGNSDNDSVNISVVDLEAPKGVCQGDITIDQGMTAYFDASPSTDNYQLSNFSWSFYYNDQFYRLYGEKNQFTFKVPGTYPVTLRVSDIFGNFVLVLFNVTVVDIEKPEAVAGPDIIINNGDYANFNGSGSSDNGIIINYTWSFLYNGKRIELWGMKQSYQFINPGYYSINLTVMDKFRNQDSDLLLVTVIDTIPPQAVISGSLTVLEGRQLRLDALGSIDNGKISKYLWTFEDTISTGNVIKNVEGPYLNYSFVKKGFHNITLTVIDQWNLSDSAFVIVKVEDTQAPIGIAGEDRTIPAGTNLTLDGSASTDDGEIVRYSWSFTYNNKEVRLEGQKVFFRFDIPGEYTINLIVYDQSNNFGGDNVIITVTNIGYLSGTVFDELLKPVHRARITLNSLDGKTYATISLSNGSFLLDVPMGQYKWSITKPGYKRLVGVIEILPMQTIMLDLTNNPLVKEEKNNQFPWWIIIFIILLILILCIVLFLIFKRKKSEEPPTVEQGETTEPVPEPETQNLTPKLETSQAPLPEGSPLPEQIEQPTPESPPQVEEIPTLPEREASKSQEKID